MVTEWIAGRASPSKPAFSDHAEFVICDHTIDLTYIHLHAEDVYLAVIHGCLHSQHPRLVYAATAYTDRLRAQHVQISMADVGAAWQNSRFLDEVYMHKRIHSSLGYLTPAEFELQWRAQQAARNVV